MYEYSGAFKCVFHIQICWKTISTDFSWNLFLPYPQSSRIQNDSQECLWLTGCGVHCVDAECLTGMLMAVWLWSHVF